MRDLLSLHIETKVSVAIILIAVSIFLITIFKSMDNFKEFNKEITQYERIRVER